MILNKNTNILIVRTDRIGDVVLTTPVFKALRQAYPHCTITVLLTPSTQGLVDGNPYINEVIVDDRKGRHKGLIGALQLARDIRRRAFDVAFVFHTKRRYNLACYLAGVPLRIGFKNDKWGGLLTHPVKDLRFTGQKHEVRYCLDVLKTVDITHVDPEIFIPKQKDAEQKIEQFFADNHITPGEAIAIHPGASDVTKIWPQASFIRLIKMMQERYQFKIILIGGKETRDIADAINAGLDKKLINAAGQLSLSETVSLLRRCRMLISNDSGPVHLASAVGIYVISLFLRNQPGINPDRWGPYGPRGYILTNKPNETVIIDEKSKMKSGKLDSITPQEVLDVVERILSGEHQVAFYW